MNLISRRHLLAAGALVLPFCGLAKAGELAVPSPPQSRRQLVFQRRREIAETELARRVPAPVTNGDEDRYPDRRASFSKTMPRV
jgi:hypothetical protein